MDRYKKFLTGLLHEAGVTINGQQPWDIMVHDDRFYKRIISGGTLALGESYMDGWWDCQKLDDLFFRLLRANLSDTLKINVSTLITYIAALTTNKGSERNAYTIGEKHYDIGNDLFALMLDKRLVYTCAYWDQAKNLDEAQENKLELVCKKIGLKKGQKVLDIGCGWGSFAKYAAEKYGATVVGVTVSKEQQELGQKLCAGLPVEIRLQDYRKIDETFDHIVSLGMFEHVGPKNYKTYMEVANRCLKDDGVFLLHTIGSNTSHRAPDPWLDKYIFPGSLLPSVAQIGKAIEKLFVLEDWHSFGVDYDKTLLAWFERFDTHWPSLKEKYGERFYRMWKYYLLSCAGLFRARHVQLWQIVLTKRGIVGGYKSVR